MSTSQKDYSDIRIHSLYLGGIMASLTVPVSDVYIIEFKKPFCCRTFPPNFSLMQSMLAKVDQPGHSNQKHHREPTSKTNLPGMNVLDLVS